jgi:hypothetical protein
MPVPKWSNFQSDDLEKRKKKSRFKINILDMIAMFDNDGDMGRWVGNVGVLFLRQRWCEGCGVGDG